MGPLTPEQPENEVGKFWIAARRFAVRLGEKLRPIDDFSEFGTKLGFGSCERVSMKNLDQVVAWSRAWEEVVGEGDRIRVDDTAQYCWEESIHPDRGRGGGQRSLEAEWLT